VVLSGELDIACIGALRAALDQALLEGEGIILVDASQLTFIDSVALSELLRYQLAAVSRQRRICLEPVSGPVAEVLDLLDLSPILIARA
jgi:anti-anti-sigma factor